MSDLDLDKLLTHKPTKLGNKKTYLKLSRAIERILITEGKIDSNERTKSTEKKDNTNRY